MSKRNGFIRFLLAVAITVGMVIGMAVPASAAPKKGDIVIKEGPGYRIVGRKTPSEPLPKPGDVTPLSDSYYTYSLDIDPDINSYWDSHTKFPNGITTTRHDSLTQEVTGSAFSNVRVDLSGYVSGSCYPGTADSITIRPTQKVKYIGTSGSIEYDFPALTPSISVTNASQTLTFTWPSETAPNLAELTYNWAGLWVEQVQDWTHQIDKVETSDVTSFRYGGLIYSDLTAIHVDWVNW